MDGYKQQQRANCLLALTRQPVGVKLFFTERELEACSYPVPRAKMPYCVMARMAGDGFSWKARLAQVGCMGGARALGLVPLDDDYRSGRMFDGLKLYCGPETAKQVAGCMTLVQRKAVGFAVAPLQLWNSEERLQPDVVLLVCGAYTAMRVVQGYTYQFGTNVEYRLSGNQAICSECTAYPLERGKLNLSMLCSGTRIKAGWKEDELALGVPYAQLDRLLDGVEATVNQMDDDAHKRRIAGQLAESSVCSLRPDDIVYHHNYFTGLVQADKKRFTMEDNHG